MKFHPPVHTEETKKKISESLKEAYRTGRHKLDLTFMERGKATRFKKGHIPWFMK